MRKTRLSPRSDKKAADMRLYGAEIMARGGIPHGYSPHHPISRIGDKLLCFCIIDNATHNRIHTNGKWAREEGWLTSVRDGVDSLPHGVPYPIQAALERWHILTGKTIPRKG